MNLKTTWPRLKTFTLAVLSVVTCAVPGFAQPTITVQPASQTILTGSNVVFNVTVDGAGPFTYQWQFNGTNLPNNIITTVAGNNQTGFSGDGGLATNAAMFAEEGLVIDQGGNLLFADVQRIRKVDTNGIITTFMGGPGGYAGDGGPATNALLQKPCGMALDRSGNLYIADSDNCRIRKVDTNGIITTVAGNDGAGFSGDGGSATNARLNFPQDVAVDSLGNFYIADLFNQRIRKVDTQGFIRTVAGSGTAGYSGDGGQATNANIHWPYGIAISAAGNLYIGDQGNSRVRMVDTNGIITTAAGGGGGGDGGAATNASLSSPRGVTMDALGSLYIADSSANRIRKVAGDGTITTVAGNGALGNSGNGGPATNASLVGPWYVAFDASENLYISQAALIKKVLASAGRPTLEFDHVTTNIAGSYLVVVSGASGSVTSSVATLTVVDPPSIVAQPVSQIVLVGGTVTFSVAGRGTVPLDYGWFFNGTNVVQDGTNATLTLNNLTTNDTGGYSVVVTNLYGSVTSSVATLTVTLPPSIIVQPAVQTVWVGSNATFSVTASGTGPFNYQWQLNGSNILNNIITTVAGNGVATYAGDGGAATNASLNGPWGVTVDSFGNLYVADHSNNRVRRVGADGVITTVAGSLNFPVGVALDTSGGLYLADTGSNRVRRLDAKGLITTVAGGGSGGDGGAATNASLKQPYGLAVSASGNLYIADYGNNRIRRVDANGIITTVAGNGSFGFSGDGGPATNASLGGPASVGLDAFGNLYIADNSNYRVRRVATNGVIATVAGNELGGYSGDGGAATAASLLSPSGLALDAFGNLYIADSGNNRVREMDTNGIITTVAGVGSAGFFGDGGAATSAGLRGPIGVALDAPGNLYIADLANSRVRKVGGSPTLALSNVVAEAAGNYTVVISSAWASITSSVAALTVNIRPSIAGTVLHADGSVTLNCAGTPSSTNRLWVATNLAPPVLWWAASTNIAGSDGTWQFTNTAAYPARFYRVSMP